MKTIHAVCRQAGRRLPLMFFALTVAFLILTGCATPPRAVVPEFDAELARLNNTARAAYDRGSLSTACELYAQALSRARALDAAAEIGNSAYNLAICRMALGENEPARDLLREAEAELTRAQANLADVLLVEAKLAYRQGRREETRVFAGQVLSNPASAPTLTHRAEVSLLEGQLAGDEGDATRAKAALAEAMRQSDGITNLTQHAGCEQLAGRIFLLEKKPAEAARCFDRETVLWRQAREAPEMARALTRAGETWRDAGQPALAADRFYRAARSHLAQGAREEAMKGVDLALACAAEAGDEAMRQRAIRLKSEIQSPVPLP